MNTLLALGTCLAAMFANFEKPSPMGKEQIRVLPVAKTPEASTVVLAMSVPEAGTVLGGNPVWIQFRIDGYALGAASQFPREDEVAVSDMGQTIHVVIDNHPYFSVNEPAIDPFNEDGFYYDTSYKFEIPYSLSEGLHIIRMFPARSFGESLKGENTFFTSFFYVGSQKNRPNIDLTGPFLTYNEPSDQMDLVSNQPVLLDFLVSNCELSQDGYKVRLTVDGKVSRVITAWQPHYIYGLRAGKHQIRLELLNSQNHVVPGVFNTVERTITVRQG